MRSKLVRFILMSCTLVFFAIQSKAQHDSSVVVYGYVRDSFSLIPLQYVLVSNINSTVKAKTNSDGFFALTAKRGNSLVFMEEGYLQKKYKITDYYKRGDTLEIWLNPKTMEVLPGVVVSGYSYQNYQDDSAARRDEFIKDIGMKKALFESSNTGAGLGISLDNLFSKKEKARKESYKLFLKLEEDKYVDYRFNSTVVSTYSGLKRANLKDFMAKYRPSYAWLRSNPSDEDLKYYIISKLRSYYNKSTLLVPDGTVRPSDSSDVD